MQDPGPPPPPPRVLVVYEGDEAGRRALVEAIALVGVPLPPESADRPDALLYRLAPGGAEGLRQRLDAHQPAAVVLLDAFDRALLAELAALPVLAVLVAPHTPEQAAAALHLALARHAELAYLVAENDRLQQVLSNRKLVERAKGVLMKRFRWAEPEAFRRLQRAAMNGRVSMADLARQILDGRDVDL